MNKTKVALIAVAVLGILLIAGLLVDRVYFAAEDVQSTFSAQLAKLAEDWTAWYKKDVYIAEGNHIGGCFKSSLTAAESEGR